MNDLKNFIEQLRFVVLGLTAALLPSPESYRCATRWGVDAAAYSMILGIVEATSGGLLFFFGGIAAVTGTSPLLGIAMLENWLPGLTSVHFMGAGLLALATWLIHPFAWFLALVGLTGVVRIFAFVASRESVGEPFVWAVLRIVQLTSQRATGAKRTRELGPLRPDRLEYKGASSLRIISSRERPEWTDGTTLEVNGRFFSYGGNENVMDGSHCAISYSFSEVDANEVLRNPQPYRPLSVSSSAAEG